MPKQVICQYSQGKGNAGPSRRPLRLKPAQISLLATRATARDSRNSLIERDAVVLVLELVKEVQVHGLVDREFVIGCAGGHRMEGQGNASNAA